MNNTDIGQKLAEAMGTFDHISDGEFTDGKMEVMVIRKDDPTFVKIFRPTTNMSDAWEVAERFDLTDLIRHPERKWVAWFHLIGDSAETAPLAICKAALKVIENQEGSKSDE